jgi:hypothetical protein
MASGVHFEDFREYLKEPSTFEVDGHPVINFTQCSKLSTAILNFCQRYKIPTNLAKHRKSKHIACVRLVRALLSATQFMHSSYLNKQLKVSASLTDDWFESTSTQLRDNELRDSRTRKREFDAWGFSSKNHKSR